MLNAYRLVEVKNGEYYTLFHGINRNRQLPIGKEIEAEVKIVKDGANSGGYLSGFNVFYDFDVAYAYLDKFNKRKLQRDIRVIKIHSHYRKFRLKPTNANVALVDRIFIPRKRAALALLYGSNIRINIGDSTEFILVESSTPKARKELYKTLVNENLTIANPNSFNFKLP